MAVVDSLSKRLFVRRVELVSELDKKGLEDEQIKSVRSDTAERLHQEVAAMSLDNFIVGPRRRYVEKYSKPDAWKALDLDATTELVHEVAGLPSALVDDDFDAKQFDLLVLRAQLAIALGKARERGT